MKKELSLSVIVSVVLAASMIFAGCQQQTATNSVASSSKDSNNSTVSAAKDGIVFDEKGHFLKYDPPITLTTNQIVSSDTMFHEGCSAENNGWTKWMKEKLGIIWKMKWVSADGASNTTKLDLAFASNDLPDVISNASISQISKYAKAGKLTALDGYLSQAPALVDYYVKDSEQLSKGTFWKPFTVDGKKYAMGAGMDSLAFWSDNFIRTDILKELNMEIPSTISETEKVFEAYHKKYPEGYALTLDKDLNGMATVLTAYEAYPDSWVEKDGKLIYGSIQPEVKKALAKLAEWYKKGYIDPEFAVKDSKKVSESIVSGNFLMYNGAWSAIANPFTPMWNALPSASVEAIPFLKGDDGKCGVMKNTWWTDCRAIASSCKNPEAMFYLLNDNLDSYYRNETSLRETMKTKYDYEFKYPVTKVQNPTNADQIAKDYPNIGQPRQLYLYNYSDAEQGCGFINDFYTQQSSWLGFYCKIPSIGNNDFKTMATAAKTGDKSGLSYDGKRMYDEWNSTHPNMLKTFVGIYDYWNSLMQGKDNVLKTNAFAGAETATMTEKGAYLSKLQLETFTQIIMGTKSVDAFDQFVSDWKANGGDKITEEVNEWYSSNNGK